MRNRKKGQRQLLLVLSLFALVLPLISFCNVVRLAASPSNMEEKYEKSLTLS